MPCLDNISDDESDNEGSDDEDNTPNHIAQLTDDDLAFGISAALTDYTKIGQDGFDVVTGLPASETIQEDFDAEVHAAGTS
jgi:hypothetical protein